jgi:hypothetical protein
MLFCSWNVEVQMSSKPNKTHEHYSFGYNSVVHKVLKHQLRKIVCGWCISFMSITFKSHVWCTKKGTNYFTRVRSRCLWCIRFLSIAFKNPVFGVLQEGTNSFALVTGTKV